MRLSLLRIVVPLAAPFALLAGCANPLFAPCQSQADCAADLRCVTLSEQLGSICTRSCTIAKKRAGLPDAVDDDVLFEEGTTQLTTVSDAECADGAVEVGAQDGNLSVQGDVVGVCRVSAEQVANGQISGDSVLSGWCAPL